MLDVFKKMEDFDILFFTPHDENEDEIKIESAHYRTRGEPIELGCAGDNSFDIVLFHYDDENGLTDLDKFQAVLIEPREYVSRMIKEDWYGFVARKTTTSARVVQEMFDNWATI
jgi:hypothetical protein